MANYKVLVEFEHEGVARTVDMVVDLTEEVAAPLVAEGKLEAVAE